MEGEKYPYGFLLNAKISIFFTLFLSDIGSSCLFRYCNTWAFGSSNGQSVPETPRNSAARGPGNYQGRGCKILREKIIQRWCPLENDLNWTDSDKVYNLWEFHTICIINTYTYGKYCGIIKICNGSIFVDFMGILGRKFH